MKLFITALLLIPTVVLAGTLSCGDVNEKRIIRGIEPTATALYEKLKNIESGSWESGFVVETFTYIGDLYSRNGKVYKIGFLATEWGEACRSTNSLFIFSSDNSCLGQYSGIIDPSVKISGSVLYFPYEKQDGNMLDLENGPPEKVWLDGQNPEWMPAKSSKRWLGSTGVPLSP